MFPSLRGGGPPVTDTRGDEGSGSRGVILQHAGGAPTQDAAYHHPAPISTWMDAAGDLSVAATPAASSASAAGDASVVKAVNQLQTTWLGFSRKSGHDREALVGHYRRLLRFTLQLLNTLSLIHI